MWLGASAGNVDFDLIRNWSGSGPNRCALVFQFEPGTSENPGALVWGFRWEDGEQPTGYDLVTSVAEQSSNLCVLVQLTGPMGYTLDGASYSSDAMKLLSGLSYDLEGAAADSRISFGFYSPNSSMGQTHAPGAGALDMVMESIEDAMMSHVIRHPLNYDEFGYPAYDYDWWIFDNQKDALWNSGWYNGYWSFWSGTGNLEDLGYSGLGMSSVPLKDGDIHAWKYLDFSKDEPDWLEPVYVASDVNTGIDRSGVNSDPDVLPEYYTLNGIRLSEPPASGFYLEKKGGHVVKRISR